MKRSGHKRDLKKITDSLRSIAGVKAIVLYGSLARGDFGATSDVDILVITDNPKRRSAVVETLALLNLDRRIQPTVRSEKELRKTDTGPVANILQEGKVIYLREALDVPVRTILDLRPYCIVIFELAGLRQNMKAKFNRAMYERSSGKYKYEGFLGEIGGRKLGRGCIMVPLTGRTRLQKFFKKYGIVWEDVRVWS